MIHLFLFLPLIAALIVPLIPDRQIKRWTAALAAALTLGIGLGLSVNGGAALERFNWISQLGMTYSVSLEGVSLLLSLVVAFMSLLAVLYAGWKVERSSAMLVLVLMMETALLGIFMARDLVLFYVFFEAALIPSLLLLSMYGGANRLTALTRFAIYTIVGSLFLLAAIIGVKVYGGAPTFALEDILKNPIPKNVQTILFLGFLAAFAVKLPLFPLHGWLAQFHEENHPSGVADVMGTLYKVGGYGLFAWALPLFPEAARDLHIPLMWISAFTAIYAAWIAFSQTSWKRLLAFAGLSHMGMVGLGVLSLNTTAATGAMYLLAFQGVYMGALFLGVGMLASRAEINAARPEGYGLGVFQGGVMGSAPILGGLTMTLWLAAIGVPGLAGFVGEFSILFGSYQVVPWISFTAGLATIAAAAYALTAYQKTFWEVSPEDVRSSSEHADPTHAEEAHDLGHTSLVSRIISDLTPLEWTILAPSVGVLVFFGIYSAPALNLIQPAARALMGLFAGGPQ